MLLSNELLPNTDQVQSQCSRLPGDFGALYAFICWQSLWRCWFPFPAGLYHLPTLPKPLPSDLLTMILLCLIGQLTCLTWTPYNSLHSYSTFLSTQSALHCEGGDLLSHHQCAASTSGSHSEPERPPHTSLLVERRQSDEANQCMGMIRRPWWSEANGQIWPGCRGHTSTLFEIHPGIFNDHRTSGPRFNVSSYWWCFLQYSAPITILGC